MIDKSKFDGIIPALLTPFKADNTINYDVLAELIEFNISKGVKGFYVCGSTAEVFLLSEKERKDLMKFCAEKVGGRVTLIAHVGCISTGVAAELAKYAETLGYDAVSAVAPFYYKFSFNEIKQYYFDIAAASSLPMFVYNFPAFSGVNLSLENFDELLSNEKVAGVKFTCGDMFLLEQLRAAHPEAVIFNGYDEIFSSGYAAGVDGGIGSTYNLMADKFIRLHAYLKEGKTAEAKKEQRVINKVIAALIKVGVMQGEKAVLNLMGFDFGVSRPPFAPLTDAQIEYLKQEVMPLL